MEKASGSMKYLNKQHAGKDHLIINTRIQNTGDVQTTELAKVVDIEVIRSLTEDFYQLTNIGVTITDHSGHILVATGWQDICINFHHRHPVTSAYCIQSDIELRSDPVEGEFKLQHCKNGMWNIYTPITVDNLHLGNLILGQFFFEDEKIPYNEFILQAEKFGYNKEQYIEDLNKVPRLKKDTVDKVMDFYSKLTHLISSMGYSNLKLGRSLLEKQALYESLCKSEDEIRNYVEQAPEGIIVTDKKGKFLKVNHTACMMCEYSREELLHPDKYKLAPDYNRIIRNIIEKTGKNKFHNEDINIITRSGKERIWTVKIINLSEEKFIGFVHDVTEQKNAEQERELTIRLLSLFNTSNDIQDSIKSVVELLKNWSGCEAVGIRMKDGEDFPYYVTYGFPSDFILKENSLCVLDKNGTIQKDKNGEVILECMCGNVICGRFDPDLLYFTEKGSFWTNSTTELLKSASPKQLKGLRNRCNTAGYESVALIPLRTTDGKYGLIQLNDSRKNAFSIEKIELFERLADSVALALMQKKVKKELQISDNRLKSIFRAAPIGIGVVSNRILTEVNSRICEMTGYSQEELIGNSAHILYPSREEYDYVGNVKYKQIAKKGTGTVETKWKKKDGTVIDILLSSSPINPACLEEGVSFTALDITERKNSEQTLRIMAETAVSPGQDIFGILVRQLAVSQNIHTALLATVDPDEINIARTVAVWNNGSYEDNFNYDLRLTPCDKVMAHGPCFYPSGIQDLFPEDDLLKRIKAESYWGAPLKDNSGSVIGILVLADIKPMRQSAATHSILSSFAARAAAELERRKAELALRKSEERLGLAMEAFGLGFWELDLDSNIFYQSPQMNFMMGLEPEHQFEDLNSYLGRLHPDDRDIVSRELSRAIEHAISFHLDCRIKHTGGEWIWVSVKGKPFEIGRRGKPRRFIGTQVNISERRKAEEALIYTKIVADDANRIKSEFMKNMSHELRTPLTAVIGFSDVLLNQDFEGLSEVQRNYIEYIYFSGKNLLGLIDRLLDFSKYEVEDIEKAEITAISPGNFVSENMMLMTKRAARKRIRLSFQRKETIDTFYADEEKLTQIMHNILDNALKFTGEGGTITVETKNTSSMFQVSVADTGIGIAEDKLESIFKPFVQIDGSVSRKYSGTGIGLALTKKFVELHGGSIQVSSEPGKGTVVTFEIPIDPRQL